MLKIADRMSFRGARGTSAPCVYRLGGAAFRLELTFKLRQRSRSSPMTGPFKSSRDVIIRTHSWAAAVRFYELVLGWPIVHRDKGMVGFETGSLRLYVEEGEPH